MYSGAKLIFLIVVLSCFYSSAHAQVKGIWAWTWSSSVNLANTNLDVAFSGEVDPDQAISASKSLSSKLKGSKYLSLGGGNAAGRWTSSLLSKITTYCTQSKFTGYAGLAFDIEEGDSGLSAAFLKAFSTCKGKGYKILVTVSHSTPYGISDGVSLMNSFFNNPSNIDYMSPQLYTSGNEGSNDYTANGVAWSAYKKFSGKLVPSIVSANLYASAQSYFKGQGVTTAGFVQWSQTAAIPSSGSSSGSSPPPSGGSHTTVRCGSSWDAANSACGTSCTTDAQCPSGQGCYNALSMSPCPSSALSDNSNVFSETTPVTGKELTPLQIGLVVFGCVMFVLVVTVVVVVILNARQKREEKV